MKRKKYKRLQTVHQVKIESTCPDQPHGFISP